MNVLSCGHSSLLAMQLQPLIIKYENPSPIKENWISLSLLLICKMKNITLMTVGILNAASMLFTWP